MPLCFVYKFKHFNKLRFKIPYLNLIPEEIGIIYAFCCVTFEFKLT